MPSPSVAPFVRRALVVSAAVLALTACSGDEDAAPVATTTVADEAPAADAAPETTTTTTTTAPPPTLPDVLGQTAADAVAALTAAGYEVDQRDTPPNDRQLAEICGDRTGQLGALVHRTDPESGTEHDGPVTVLVGEVWCNKESDPVYRDVVQAAVNAEVERACNQASVVDTETPVEDVVTWDPEWELVTTRDALVGTVWECSRVPREQARQAFLDSCERADIDQIVRDPNAYAGRCVRVYVNIFQLDGATGPCAFLGNMGPSRSTRWYDYDDNAAFVAADTVSFELGAALAQSAADCPVLDGIDQDDYVEIWATGLGGYTYDTAAGGTNTVPSWKVESISLIAKD